ncbi:hypothetical protein APHACPA_0715 [Rickettsia amblyommatis str. Ac/Pa]|uniref:Uncharacterized protein n=1 Tax=Rickettsia amblyommatis str. Ac/Pa TaxID=1359164 RepID=A0A0F3N1X3_RICAM|nr:hypothetical protein APHACPA_0715 [Rickettsia amblyommatis str. Ac/Pa]
MRAAVGCVATSSNILRLLRQLLCNFPRNDEKPNFVIKP